MPVKIKKLTLHSERYGSTGNIGDNFQRLLGTPTLDPLQTVIREAIQNIADAALPETGPTVQVRLRELTRDQQQVLASRILASLPRESSSRKLLSTTRSCKKLAVMEICDFGTAGLAGPTRSDRIPTGVRNTNFIDFLRNIGTARDSEQGGGTYGFGKVALYRASACRTIIVDTLPNGVGPRRRRLIGCHVGSSFELPGKKYRCRYTGRHWWGVPDPEDDIVDPVEGRAAQELAQALGFPDRTEGRSGTSIMILDLDTQGESLELVGSRVVEGLLWNFWPRMMRDTPPHHLFTCSVDVNGCLFPIPSPEDFPPLDLFSKAMRAVRNGTGNDVRQIASQKPAKALGTLAIERGFRTQRRLQVEEDESLFPPAACHIALMRPVELIVKYLEGRPLPDERFEWAGAFVASSDNEVERAFADSEPPAHDDWIPSSFPRGRAKTFVNVALRRLNDIASEMGSMTSGQPETSDTGPPLARAAGRLGAALAGVGGDGAGSRRGTGRGRRARPMRAKATRPLFERLEQAEEGTVAVFSTEIRQDPRRSGSSLVAHAAVVIEGSSVSRFDRTIPQPVVLSIRSRDGDVTSSSDRLELDGNEGGFEIRILVPGDCAVTVEANVLSQT